MAREILLRPNTEMYRKIKSEAKSQQPPSKLAPMVMEILRRYFADRAIAQAAPEAPKVQS